MAAEEESDDFVGTKSQFPEWFAKLEEDTAESILYLLTDVASESLTTETRLNIQKSYCLTEQQVVEMYSYLKENRDSDRENNDVRQPPRNPLPHGLLFTYNGEDINTSLLKDHLIKEGKLLVKDILLICKKVKKIFRAESNLLVLEDPITVAGDIHGQFFDLLRLFDVGGDPSQTKYLFLGDYVDRGCFSCEVLLLMFSYKITYPDTFFMLRGNHECRHLSNFFNFKDECKYKYNLLVYDAVMEVFDCLPLAATINKKFLCAHGGLSPDIRFVADIDKIDRFREIPREGPFCDLVWADPIKEDDVDNEYKDWFSPNDVRHCSYKFGSKAVQFFLLKNNLTAIIRGHEVFEDGYKMHFQVGNTPQVFTIFSAPNYCDVYRNKGSIMKIRNNSLNIGSFIWSPHPYYLPNFMDVFSWSLPFVAQKVTHMLNSVLETVTSNIENGQTVTVQSSNEAEVLKQKALAVIKIMKIYKTIRDEQESIQILKQLSPNQKLPHGILRSGPEAIKHAIENFEATKEADVQNEAIPDIQANPTIIGKMFSLTSEEELRELLTSQNAIPTPIPAQKPLPKSSGLLNHSHELAQQKIEN